MVAGGDIVSRNGKGSESIYGGLFDDEDLSREIDVEG
jgi:peptidyl-prolyl isomerase G (cyclophilin G)